MADLMLDMIYEVVKNALERSNLITETKLVKNYTDFCIELKLEKWTNLELDETVSKSGSPHCLYDEGVKHDFDNELSAVMDISIKNENYEFTVGYGAQGSNEISDQQSVLLKKNVERVESAPQEEDIAVPKMIKVVPDRVRRKGISSTQRGKKLSATSKRSRGSREKIKILKGSAARKQPGVKHLKCDFCDYRTDGHKRLEKHVSTHTTEKPIACSLCEYRCKRDDLLMEHMKIHTGEKPYKCDVCDYECSRPYNLTTHKKCKHSDVKSYSCKYCDFCAKLPASLKHHERRMHQSEGQLHHCEHCDFKTMNEKRFLAHVRAHELNTSFTCCICGANFIEKTDLQFHTRQHKAEPRVKKVPCPYCEKKFPNQATLKSHVSYHTGVKEFKCRLCGSEFRLYQCMMKHHRKKHPDELAFHCEPCNFLTNSLREYKRHPSTLLHLDSVSH